MHPFLASSDHDPFQVAIIVIAVIAGFVKWLWENWMQKRAEQRQIQPPPSAEEQRLREAAWRRQTGQTSAPPPIPPVAAPSPWDELRKAWQELKEAAGQAPARPVPPRNPPPVPQRQPLRQQQPSRQSQPPPQRQAVQQPARTPAPVPAAAPAAMPAAGAAPTAVVSPPSAASAGPVLAKLRHLRRDPALMRQAILMQEILGPPKALQSSGDFAI